MLIASCSRLRRRLSFRRSHFARPKIFVFFFKHPHPASYPHSFADNSTPQGLRLVSKEKSKRTRWSWKGKDRENRSWSFLEGFAKLLYLVLFGCWFRNRLIIIIEYYIFVHRGEGRYQRFIIPHWNSHSI